jgi:hypothetical protein
VSSESSNGKVTVEFDSFTERYGPFKIAVGDVELEFEDANCIVCIGAKIHTKNSTITLHVSRCISEFIVSVSSELMDAELYCKRGKMFASTRIK